MINISIPGREELQLHHLVLNMNGTLTVDGSLIGGVPERLAQLKDKLHTCLLTADTFGTGAQVARDLGIEIFTVSPDMEEWIRRNLLKALIRPVQQL